MRDTKLIRQMYKIKRLTSLGNASSTNRKTTTNIVKVARSRIMTKHARAKRYRNQKKHTQMHTHIHAYMHAHAYTLVCIKYICIWSKPQRHNEIGEFTGLRRQAAVGYRDIQ